MPTAGEAGRVLAALADREPTLGRGRLLCLDGPAGAGKTTLAEQIRSRASAAGLAAEVIHMDDLYHGWEGLPEVAVPVADLLAPLGSDRPGHYRRYDWHAGRYAERVTVPPVPLLILEGAGSAPLRIATAITVLAWVDAPAATRRARALARDGDLFAPWWERWAAAEEQVFARERVPERADLVVDTGGTQAADPGSVR